MPERLVIIPTYNEIENISKILTYVLSLPMAFDILIVDDGSPDGTASVVKQFQTNHKSVHLLERKGKSGLGTAYIAGFKWALDHQYEYIFEMDADFSHNPDDLIRLYEACSIDGADMSVGSRYIKGGKLVNWGLDRKVLSFGASLYVKMITWMPVNDPTAGFVCYTNKVLRALDLDKIRFVGYAFQIEMKFNTYLKGFKIKEIPITFTDRVEGQSKMSSKIIKEAILGVLSLKWNSVFK
ncbi:MAG: polyprenol monophosphomannose synthase [Saprospiraceae bacterium]|nr:polyprenol monophosphomannose synthase [Saprospiraceae bacterium]